LKHTFELESEIVCEMPAFMIATEKEEGVGIPDLEGPQIQNALWDGMSWRRSSIDAGRTSILK
jgi:hypothetical protein